MREEAKCQRAKTERKLEKKKKNRWKFWHV